MYQVTRFEISYRQTSVHIEADAKFALIEKMIATLKDLLNKFFLRSLLGEMLRSYMDIVQFIKTILKSV